MAMIRVSNNIIYYQTAFVRLRPPYALPPPRLPRSENMTGVTCNIRYYYYYYTDCIVQSLYDSPGRGAHRRSAGVPQRISAGGGDCIPATDNELITIETC